jgi:hypothetical protein
MHAQPRPSLSRDARHIIHTHTGSLAAATLLAQHSACSMLGQHCHTILPNPAADLDLDLIQPVCLSVVSHTSLGPRRHRITQHCTAHDTLHATPSRQSNPSVRSTLYTVFCTLLRARRLPSALCHIAVSSTESAAYSLQPVQTSPAHAPIAQLISQSPGSALRFDGPGG